MGWLEVWGDFELEQWLVEFELLEEIWDGAAELFVEYLVRFQIGENSVDFRETSAVV